ncbi:MAG TPA: response regulator transcription factor [Aquificales bacterium]|nr:response regulator transcription factor [Aquificales bacterium]
MEYVIAVVEDDPDLLEVLEYNLQKEGYRVFPFERGEQFLQFMSEGVKPHLIVLDVMLPGMSGFRLAEIIKGNEAYRDIPVVFLTAKTLEEDRLKGFDLGADDYIPKPFSVREFLARIRAILRRYYPQTGKVLEVGDLKMYPERFEVLCGDKRVDLTRAEFKILQTLLERKGEVVKRSTLMDALAPFGREATSRTVDVHITKLRKKLGECGEYIKTVRGVGYKVSPESG